MQKETKPLLGIFAQYVTLNVLGMIGLSCYILADTYFVAKGLGTNGLTALNLAIPVYSFINGLGLMIGMGGGIRYSLNKSSGTKKEGNIIFAESSILALGIAIILVIIGLFGASGLATVLGADAVTFENTKVYLRWILIFSPAFLMNNVVICFVRNDGNPTLSTLAMLSGSFSNIVLDYVFIFICKWGMFGAVFATGLAPIISLLVLSVHFISKKNNFSFEIVLPKIKNIFKITQLGVAFLITEVSAGVVMILFNMLILKLGGNIGVAAYGVVANLSLMATSIFTGVAQGIQPILSQSYGVGNYFEMKKTFKYALITGFTFAAAIYLVVLMKAEMIVNLFNEEQNAQLLEMASYGLRIYFMAFVGVGFNIITAVFFNARDNSSVAFVISILRGFAIIIPSALILSTVFGMTGVWCALPVTEGLTALVGILFLCRKSKQKRRDF